MELPKVSVVTITYGHEKYITETLDGVLMQQYKGPVEFIIANDNSPDATDEVVKKYFLENSVPGNFEIKYTNHETNKGMMPNFVWALEQATGEYITLCEGDDYWTDPLKLQKQVDFLEKNKDFSMICHNAQVTYEGVDKKSNIFSKRISDTEIAMEVIINEWTIPTASMVFRSECIKKLPVWFCDIYSGDFTLALLLRHYGKIFFFSEVMSVYRLNYSGSSASAIYKNRNIFIWNEHIKLLNHFNEYSCKKYDKLIYRKLIFLENEIKFAAFKKKGIFYAAINMPKLFVSKLFNRLTSFF